MLAADEDKLCSESDPSIALADFLSPLAQENWVSCVVFERISPHALGICITLAKELYDDTRGGGANVLRAQKAWNRLSPSPGTFYGVKTITIPLEVRREASNLAFTPKAVL